MAQTTNFGKAWTLSMACRLAHPASSLTYAQDPRIQVAPGNGPWSIWMILVHQNYFTSGSPVGINVDHNTLTAINAQGTNSVFGMATHGATPWYIGNHIPLIPSQFPAITPDNNNDSATLNLFGVTRNVTFQAAGTYPMSIGGVAFCLSNATGVPGVSTTPGDTEVVWIHEFTNAPLSITSSGQILTIQGGTAILAEA